MFLVCVCVFNGFIYVLYVVSMSLVRLTMRWFLFWAFDALIWSRRRCFDPIAPEKTSGVGDQASQS